MNQPISRRACLFGSSAAGLAAQIPGPRANRRLPNILWILAEDISPQLSCYGEPLVQTPNLDRMAREGVRCESAFTNAPVCSASRSALATGMYQTSIGAHNHRTLKKKPLPAGVGHVCDYLHQSGYFTALCAPPPGSKRPAGHGTGAYGSGKTDYNFTVAKPFDSSDWSHRPKEKPFFAQLSIQESHKMSPGWPLARKLTPNIDQSRLKLPPYWPDHPVARNEYANYLEAIQLVDRYVGEILTRLEHEGVAENTLVFFLGDNGSCTFRGKQFLYEGGIRVPLLLRWPGRLNAGTVRSDLIEGIDVTAATLAAAGIEPPSNMHGRNFLADNAPQRPHIFAARDRCDIAIERMRCVRDSRYKYIRNFLPGIPYMQRNPYKEEQYPTWNLVKQLHQEGKLNPVQSLFAAGHKPVEELYDLHSDPHEVNSLAGDSAQQDRLLSMRKLLDDWIVQTGDQGSQMEDSVAVYENYLAPKTR